MLIKTGLRSLLFIALLALTTLALSSTPGPAVPPAHAAADSTLYLPTIQRNSPYVGIFGYLTANNTPVSGLSVGLWFHNGVGWSLLSSTTTDANGRYTFLSAPTLIAGEKYCVVYENPGTTTYLSYVATRDLTAYTAQDNASLGTFDIADIQLGTPGPNTIVTLPSTFTWTRRPSTPTDSYSWTIFDPTTALWGITNALGYVSSFYATYLPAGFTTYTAYGWSVAVESPAGDYGEAYYYNPVAFTNTSSAPSAIPADPLASLFKTSPNHLERLERIEERMLPHRQQ